MNRIAAKLFRSWANSEANCGSLLDQPTFQKRRIIMNTIKVRDIEIGAGAPKIIVPIVGVTKEDILNEAKTFDSIPVDVVEWRVDWFEHVFEFDKVEDVLKDLRTVLGNIPLLLTFRTKKEGGEKAIDTKEAHAELNLARGKERLRGSDRRGDLYRGRMWSAEIIDGAHAAGVKGHRFQPRFLTRRLPNPTSSTVCARCRIWALIFRRSQSCHRAGATCSHCFPLLKRW